MQVLGNLKAAIQIDTQKKAQDVVKNVLGNLLEKTFENTKKIEEMAAAATGKGQNLNIKG
jgi:hypothetical protein